MTLVFADGKIIKPKINGDGSLGLVLVGNEGQITMNFDQRAWKFVLRTLVKHGHDVHSLDGMRMILIKG